MMAGTKFELDHDYEPEHASDSVPWPRVGHPSHKLDERREQERASDADAYRWGYDIVNRGVDWCRLYTDRRLIEYGSQLGHIDRGAAEERAFAELWDHYNNAHSSTPIFSLLLENNAARNDHERRLMEYAAATIIQWLGTNVGSGFVDEARQNARGLIFDLWPGLIRHMKLECAIGMTTHQALKRAEGDFKEAKNVGRQSFARARPS
jgi:hypothetical protein